MIFLYTNFVCTLFKNIILMYYIISHNYTISSRRAKSDPHVAPNLWIQVRICNLLNIAVSNAITIFHITEFIFRHKYIPWKHTTWKVYIITHFPSWRYQNKDSKHSPEFILRQKWLYLQNNNLKSTLLHPHSKYKTAQNRDYGHTYEFILRQK